MRQFFSSMECENKKKKSITDARNLSLTLNAIAIKKGEDVMEAIEHIYSILIMISHLWFGCVIVYCICIFLNC